jgi:hypothetical protein
MVARAPAGQGMKDDTPAKTSVKKWLTEKQEAKVREIAMAAMVDDLAIFDPKEMRAASKMFAKQAKACDRILTIIAPPKAEKK